MTERYFGIVVAVPDEFTVVINKGTEHDVQDGQKFLVLGLGDIIIDPDTKEELEKLEIVRGRVSVSHVQQKISTLKSYEYKRTEDKKEIKKVDSRSAFAAIMSQNTVTESIIPGKKYLKELNEAEVGDYVVKL